MNSSGMAFNSLGRVWRFFSSRQKNKDKHCSSYRTSLNLNIACHSHPNRTLKEMSGDIRRNVASSLLLAAGMQFVLLSSNISALCAPSCRTVLQVLLEKFFLSLQSLNLQKKTPVADIVHHEGAV